MPRQTVPAADCHAHVFSVDAKPVAGARYRPAYAATLDAWQSHWRAAGITHGVLVQPSFLGTDHGEMLAALARDRARLRGVAVVDPSFDEARLRALGDAGIAALRFNLHGTQAVEPWFQGAWRELLERAARLGWHLEVFMDTGLAPRIAKLLEPIAIPAVFDHFAVPDPRDPGATYEALARLGRTRPVYCKLSAPYRLQGLDADACARDAKAALGEANVVWGSDWPFTRHEDAVAYEAMRHRAARWAGANASGILWDNAARLYRFA
jgi:predicted TIM-barrel fold metal-dependent hydrolase